MKLIYFSEQTLPRTKSGNKSLPSVSFTKMGLIHLNFNATALLELKLKDKVSIAQDEENPINWYIFKDPTHGFELRYATDKKALFFNHKSMCVEIMEAVGRDSSVTNRFLIAGTPTTLKNDKTKYWGILINS